MHTEPTTQAAGVPIRAGIATLSGFGLRLAVERRELVLSDGVGDERRQSRFSKAEAAEINLRRVVALGRTGSVTFEALRWLRDLGAGLIVLDRDERVVTAIAATRRDDPSLRRAQAGALPSTPIGAAVTRYLLGRKIERQRRVLDTFGLEASRAADVFDRAQDTVARKQATVEEMLSLESQVAARYWTAWANVSLSFSRKPPVPAHWERFSKRESPFTMSPRGASNPVNAILNYSYALLEAETTIALVAIGLDPGLGIFHRDHAYRASFTCDVMEAVRPDVDGFVLDLFRRRTFAARDFSEGRDGIVRIMPPLSHELGTTSATWARLVAPIVEHVAEILSGKRVTTILSLSRRTRSTRPKQSPIIAALHEIRPTCRSCGVTIPSAERLYCETCSHEVRAGLARKSIAAAQERLRIMRAAGKCPLRAPDVRERIARAQRERWRAEAEWVDDGSLDGIDFTRDVLPRLARIPTRQIARATGLKPSSCRCIRSGQTLPHRRFWRTLMSLA